jgi:F420H(2)-dependent quinone reductase
VKHSPLTVRLVQAGTALHIVAYRLLRGNVPQRWLGKYCMLLTTVGRKSGKQRISPLLFLRDGEDYVVVASWGGNDTHPHWFTNLLANPLVGIEDHGKRLRARASVIDDQATYQKMWQRFVEVYPDYNMYQRRTERNIPLVKLQPIQG